MPVRNAIPHYFRQAVESVFSQTTPHWNLIVVHDADESTAHTLSLLEELASRNDARVRIEQNDSKMLSGALNTGMKKATTPYVCTLLSDDLLASEAIETMSRAIAANPSIDFFYSSRKLIDENGKSKSKILQAKSFSIADFRNYGPVKHLQCWKVSSALKIGGMDESLGLHGADDYDFPWCMAEAGYSFQAVPECLYYYREHSGYRLTTHVPLDIQIHEIRKILRKHGLSETDIEEQIKKRKKGYLRQALYSTESNHEQRFSWITRLWKSEKE
jgi:glycosyltransferase involved in cell wall biosynthesis